jgi:hypothetical protein
MRIYQTGSTVRINRPFDPHWHDKTGKILGNSKYHDTYMVQIDGETDPCWFLESQMVPADITNVTAAMDPSPDEVIAWLTEELYHACMDATNLRKMYQQDMAHWETVMRETKDKQGWCDEGTNKVIAQLNSGFSGWTIEPYEQEFEVEVTLSAHVSTTASVMVLASSQEAANELVLDDPETYLQASQLLAEEFTCGCPDIEAELY